jgi:hypothetical protein
MQIIGEMLKATSGIHKEKEVDGDGGNTSHRIFARKENNLKMQENNLK